MNDSTSRDLVRWIGANAAGVARDAAEVAYGDEGARAVAHFEAAYRQFAHAIELGDVELYLEDLRWLIRADAAHRNDPMVLLTIAESALDVLAARVPTALRAFVVAAIERVRALADEPRITSPETYLHGPLTEEFFDLCAFSDERLGRFVKDALDIGLSRRALYIDVIEPAQREIGLRWQNGRMTDSEERERTARVQRILIGLRRQSEAEDHLLGKLAGAVAPGDLHTIGLQMVCDIAALDGWESVVVPAGLSAEETIAALVDARPGAIALSAMMSSHVASLVPLIAELRTHDHVARIPILVGGAPFNRFPHLAAVVGADGTADDAAEAVDLLSRLAMQAALRR